MAVLVFDKSILNPDVSVVQAPEDLKDKGEAGHAHRGDGLRDEQVHNQLYVQSKRNTVIVPNFAYHDFFPRVFFDN